MKQGASRGRRMVADQSRLSDQPLPVPTATCAYRILHKKGPEGTGRRDELKSFRSQIVERNRKGETKRYRFENKEDKCKGTELVGGGERARRGRRPLDSRALRR